MLKETRVDAEGLWKSNDSLEKSIENLFAFSAALEAAGVIGSAADFNSYLVRNGKSSVINVGVFDIPYDSDYDVIADIITK